MVPKKSVFFLTFLKGYSRKKYLGWEDGRRYIFLWVVGAESFQIIWVIGVRPNLITWVVGVSLRGRGRSIGYSMFCVRYGIYTRERSSRVYIS